MRAVTEQEICDEGRIEREHRDRSMLSFFGEAMCVVHFVGRATVCSSRGSSVCWPGQMLRCAQHDNGSATSCILASGWAARYASTRS